VRSSTADELERLTPPLNLSLEQALEFIGDDECVESRPRAVRLRKVVLDQAIRGRYAAGPARPKVDHRPQAPVCARFQASKPAEVAERSWRTLSCAHVTGGRSS